MAKKTGKSTTKNKINRTPIANYKKMEQAIMTMKENLLESVFNSVEDIAEKIGINASLLQLESPDDFYSMCEDNLETIVFKIMFANEEGIEEITEENEQEEEEQNEDDTCVFSFVCYNKRYGDITIKVILAVDDKTGNFSATSEITRVYKGELYHFNFTEKEWQSELEIRSQMWTDRQREIIEKDDNAKYLLDALIQREETAVTDEKFEKIYNLNKKVLQLYKKFKREDAEILLGRDEYAYIVPICYIHAEGVTVGYKDGHYIISDGMSDSKTRAVDLYKEDADEMEVFRTKDINRAYRYLKNVQQSIDKFVAENGLQEELDGYSEIIPFTEKLFIYETCIGGYVFTNDDRPSGILKDEYEEFTEEEMEMITEYYFDEDDEFFEDEENDGEFDEDDDFDDDETPF